MKEPKLLDEKSIFIGDEVVIGEGVTIYENNRIEGKTAIGNGCVLLPNNLIRDSVFGENCTVNHSQSEGAKVGNGVQIGPFARLRKDTVLCDGVKVGNFVEVKNATLGKNTKASHLAYIGDCEVGENCNIGCGAIFVNYDGKSKHRTTVGDNCFIGSNCNIIAPVNIADNSYICAGTTVTKDTQNLDFVIGRVEPTVKSGRAKQYLKEIK